jgi:cation transport protein ChaC
MARACGPRGSTAEYLHNTVRSLEEHGIRDRNLWTLQRLVADEIDAMSISATCSEVMRTLRGLRSPWTTQVPRPRSRA